MKKCGIYKITSPSGKIYIGQARNFDNRMMKYKRLEKQCIGRVLYNSLKKYGFDAHQTEIIHELPNDISQQEINQQEIFYIKKFRNDGFKMMNMTEGGEGSWGYKHDEAAIAKMKELHKGKWAGENNPRYKNGLKGEANPMFGKKRPRWIIEKLRQGNIGKKRSDDSRRKQSDSLKGKYAGEKSYMYGKSLSESCKEAIKKSFSTRKPVLQFNIDGSFVREHGSVQEATIRIKNKRGDYGIGGCCNGETLTSLGYIWKYKYDLHDYPMGANIPIK